MGFYKFFIIFICNTYLILFNAFTAKAADSSYTLELSHNAGKCISRPSAPRENSSSSSIVQCAAGNPFEKLEIECKASPKLDDDHVIAWYLGPKSKSDKETLIESNEKVQIDDNGQELKIKSLDVVDARLYHCRVVKKGEERQNLQYQAQQSIEVQVIPRVSGARKDVTAIEENPISLNCTVTTSVPVKVEWQIDTPYGKNETFSASKDRIELRSADLLTNNMLVIQFANMTLDRGYYYCWATSEYGNSTSQTKFHLRVKSKYAALWPFLGICTEVVILCVIILIYEKKRDKTELEESDTDQGPETKSSPDHGQDNVRYRK